MTFLFLATGTFLAGCYRVPCEEDNLYANPLTNNPYVVGDPGQTIFPGMPQEM